MRPAVCITTVNESTSHAKSISRSGLHCIQAPEVARQDDLAGTVGWIGEAQKRRINGICRREADLISSSIVGAGSAGPVTAGLCHVVVECHGHVLKIEQALERDRVHGFSPNSQLATEVLGFRVAL